MAEAYLTSSNSSSESEIDICFDKMKTGLKIPSAFKKRVSLSDIIAATIGDEARSGDALYTDDSSFFIDFLPDSENVVYQQTATRQTSSFSTTENSNNACDLFNQGFETGQNANQCGEDFKAFSSISEQANGNGNEDISSAISEQIDVCSNKIDVHEDNSLPSVGFGMEIDFLSSLFAPGENGEVKLEPPQPAGTAVKKEISTAEKEQSEQTVNISYDSDLEDSMHFVDPEETSSPCAADVNIEPISKKPRVGLHDSSSCPVPIEFQHDFFTMFNDDFQQPQMNGITRTRSFSGTIKPKLSRQSARCNLRDINSQKTPNIARTRSFSEACNRNELSPLGDSRFNTSLSSLLESPENNPLSNNPFFGDLKSLLISDCRTTDCPKTLFETLSNRPKQDVYARERNLQSKFSLLQAKYPDEVRELSCFYRQQSAEVETERLNEIHDENVPKSYRNHLNSYYDNQLHMIMERVEKSIGLLSTAKRDIVTIYRPFKSRPLLSRKAVKMMEEWYSRNYEHPYPGPTAVEALAKAGEISNEQVKKWFANKRNRCKNTKPVTEIANINRKRQYSARW